MANNVADQPPGEDAQLAEAKAALAEAIAQLPADVRAMLPTDAEGKPQVELVQALYRYEHLGFSRWSQHAC